MRHIASTRHFCQPTTAKGFTYLELVIVVLIVGICAAAAGPRFAEALSQHRARSAALRIQADLAYARGCAIARSQNITVQFSTDNHTCTIPGLKSLDRPNQTYAVSFADAPYEAAIASAVLGGDSQVVFDLNGHPDSGGVVTVQSGGRQQTVTLNAESGKATVP